MKNLSSAFGLNSDGGSILLYKFELETERDTSLLDFPESDSLNVPTDEDIDAIADQAEETTKDGSSSKSIVFEVVGKCPAEVERILNFGLEGMGGEKLEAELPDISFSRSDSLENPTSYKLLFLDNPNPMAVQEAVLKVLRTIPNEARDTPPNILIASPHFSPEEGGGASRYALGANISGIKKGKRRLIYAPSDHNPEAWAMAIREEILKILEPDAPKEVIMTVGDAVTPKKSWKNILWNPKKGGRKSPRTLKILGDA